VKPERKGTSRNFSPHGAELHWTSAAKPEREVIQEIAAEFTTEELLEFLEADHAPVQADPEFRERLREELWELLERRTREGH
jgi:hypothetical protein